MPASIHMRQCVRECMCLFMHDCVTVYDCMCDCSAVNLACQPNGANVYVCVSVLSISAS